MKILAYMILHTGRPYIAAAVEAILPQVDKLIIFYAKNPSQGFNTDIPCPDTRQQLWSQVHAGAGAFGDKVEWIDGEWPNEGEHVNAVSAHTEGYDWLWRLDADEVAPEGMVQEMIRQAEPTGAKIFRVPFVHFWRCFHKVCRDGSQPIRLINLRRGIGERTLDSLNQAWEVWHFGYAQPTKYIRYKMHVSGHRPEWRDDWFMDRWIKNAQKDVHPVMFPTHWHTEDFDKYKLPDLLKRHPYFGYDPIEEFTPHGNIATV
jgi:hypothetical protein